MIVWNGIESYPRDSAPVVASIGNYDGVHVGHARILAGAVEDARERGLPSLLVTFDPHPTTVVAPGRRPSLLTTRRQKFEILEGLGVDALLILRFDAALAAKTGEEFLDQVFLERVRLATLHVGFNFRFGHDRAGDLDLLRRMGASRGFGVVGVPQVVVDGETVSSSAIRRAVDDGDVERARRMIGRPFEVTGIVVRGEGRGRSMDFPTANVDVENEIVPRRGVYITETSALASRSPSVTNVGVRPTFGPSPLSVETHLLDFDEDLHGERIEIRFLARLRDEVRFPGPSELADQIARDRAAAAAWFQRLSISS